MMIYNQGDLTKSLFGYTDNRATLTGFFNEKQISKPKIAIKSPTIKASKIKKTPKIQSSQSDSYKSCLFIGNLPIETTKKEIKSLLKPFGKIVNMRFRSIPLVSKSTISLPNALKSKNKSLSLSMPPPTSDLPYSLAARICHNNPVKSLICAHSSRTNKNAYINFDSEEAVIKAIQELNGYYYKDSHHLRLDFAAAPKKSKSSGNVVGVARESKIKNQSHTLNQRDRTIFLGNLPVLDCEEEDIWKLFDGEQSLPVESVRLIRNNDGIRGTGCGFLIFKHVDSVALAVMKNEKLKLNGRLLRIKKCFKKDPRSTTLNKNSNNNKRRPNPKSNLNSNFRRNNNRTKPKNGKKFDSSKTKEN